MSNFEKIYIFIYDLSIKNFKFFFRKNKRFFVISFIFINFILDKKNKTFYTLRGRNFYDYITIREIFIEECYSLENFKQNDGIIKFYNDILENGKVPLIIDAGSNIGASPFYFSKTYEKAKVVCFEIDKLNIKLLKQNNDDRIDVNLNGLGSENKTLFIDNDSDDPRSYRLKNTGTNKVKITNLRDIINHYKSKNFIPFLLKIDIEGYEKELFNIKDNFVEDFKIVIVEPHDWLYPGEMTSKNLICNLSGQNRDFLILNENILSIKN